LLRHGACFLERRNLFVIKKHRRESSDRVSLIGMYVRRWGTRRACKIYNMQQQDATYSRSGLHFALSHAEPSARILQILHCVGWTHSPGGLGTKLSVLPWYGRLKGHRGALDYETDSMRGCERPSPARQRAHYDSFAPPTSAVRLATSAPRLECAPGLSHACCAGTQSAPELSDPQRRPGLAGTAGAGYAFAALGTHRPVIVRGAHSLDTAV
jgi:hypothetical protein